PERGDYAGQQGPRHSGLICFHFPAGLEERRKNQRDGSKQEEHLHLFGREVTGADFREEAENTPGEKCQLRLRKPLPGTLQVVRGGCGGDLFRTSAAAQARISLMTRASNTDV